MDRRARQDARLGRGEPAAGIPGAHACIPIRRRPRGRASQVGDQIVSVDGAPIDSQEAFETVLVDARPRPAAEARRCAARAASGPSPCRARRRPPESVRAFSARSSAWPSAPASQGLRITVVDREGLAAQAGLKTGDILLAVNGTAVRTIEDVDHVLQRDLNKPSVVIEIGRGRFSYTLTLPSTSRRSCVGSAPSHRPAAPSGRAADPRGAPLRGATSSLRSGTDRAAPSLRGLAGVGRRERLRMANAVGSRTLNAERNPESASRRLRRARCTSAAPGRRSTTSSSRATSKGPSSFESRTPTSSARGRSSRPRSSRPWSGWGSSTTRGRSTSRAATTSTARRRSA